VSTYLPIAKQAEALNISRGSVYNLPRPVEAAFCVETLEDALARHGKPDILQHRSGQQFTGAAFTGVLIENEIAISMDGKGA
jgi:putative transposase